MKQSKEIKDIDVPRTIMKIMLAKNPNATAGQLGRSYKALKKYLEGCTND